MHKSFDILGLGSTAVEAEQAKAFQPTKLCLKMYSRSVC